MSRILTIQILILLLLLQSLFSQTLSLEQCKQLAIEKNTDIQIKHIHIQQARELEKAALTQFFPSFGFSGSYIRMNKQFQLFDKDLIIPVLPADFYDPSTGTINSSLLYHPDLMPLAFVIDPETGYPLADINGNPVFQQYAWLPGDQLTFGQKNNYLMNLGLMQPVYSGGKIRNLHKMSKQTVEMAKITLTQEQINQLSEIENLYWDLITLKEQNALAWKYKIMLEKLIEDIQNYASEGIILNNELLKAQISLNEAELNIVKTENGIKLMRKLLCQKIGLPMEQFFEPLDTVIPFEPALFSSPQLKETALQQRPELLLLQRTVEMTELGVKIMQSRFLPDIAFTANYLFMNPNPFAGFTKTFGSDYNLGVVMNVPIFHWGERFHTLSVAKSEYKIAQMILENSNKLITLEIEKNLNTLNESALEVKMASLSLEYAEANLKVMTDKFEEGMCKVSDLLESQLLWKQASVDYIKAKAAYKKNLVELEKSAGIYK